LIEKKGSARKNMTYGVSEKGNAVIAAYLDQRRAVLLRLFERISPSPKELADLIMQMHVMIGIYDQARDLIISRQP